MNFLKRFGTWAIFTCLLPLAFLLTSKPARPFRMADDLHGFCLLFLTFLLIPAVGSLVLGLPIFSRGDISGRSLFAGILLGILLPSLFGFVWIQIDPGFGFGFGSGAWILLASFLTAAPSAVGGALAGWIRSRSS
jgi:hypothetical protein